MIAEKTEIVLPSKLESVDKAAEEAARFATQNGLGEMELFGIDMAVREAVVNAVKHGNKLDETKDIQMTLSSSPESFEITVRDFGNGFEVDGVADCTAEENLLKASGRGIFFIRNFMDEVEWTSAPGGGTLVRMTKKR